MRLYFCLFEELTMKKSRTTKHMVCIQKTYNGQTYAFKVVSPNEIVFEVCE